MVVLNQEKHSKYNSIIFEGLSNVLPTELHEEFCKWYSINNFKDAVKKEYKSFFENELPLTQQLSKAFEIMCAMTMDMYDYKYKVAPSINGKTPDFLVCYKNKSIITEIYTVTDTHSFVEVELSDIEHCFDVLLDEIVIRRKPSHMTLESYIAKHIAKNEIVDWLDNLDKNNKINYQEFRFDDIYLSLSAFYSGQHRSITQSFFSNAPRCETIKQTLTSKVLKYREIINNNPFIIVVCDGTDNNPLVFPDLLDAFFGPYLCGIKLDCTKSVLSEEHSDKISAVIYFKYDKANMTEEICVIHNPFAALPISCKCFPEQWNHLKVLKQDSHGVVMKLFWPAYENKDNIFCNSVIYLEQANYK